MSFVDRNARSHGKPGDVEFNWDLFSCAAPSDLSDRSFELCNFNSAQFYPSLRLRSWRDKVLLRTFHCAQPPPTHSSAHSDTCRLSVALCNCLSTRLVVTVWTTVGSPNLVPQDDQLAHPGFRLILRSKVKFTRLEVAKCPSIPTMSPHFIDIR